MSTVTSGVPQGPTLDFSVSPLLIQTVGSRASSANVQRSHKKDEEKLLAGPLVTGQGVMVFK